MPLTFASSPRSTLGIEWELALIDTSTGLLSPSGPELLGEMQQRWPGEHLVPHATSELLTNTIELVTAPHTTVAGATAELRELGLDVLTLAQDRGLGVIGTGSHPFARWEDQGVTQGERYARFIDRTRWWGRNMLIWGVHVHMGVDRPERVIPLLNGLLAHYPHFQALSASSPFWRGESTGYASNRTLMFQQLSTAGLPPALETWDDFERVLDDLIATGVIEEATEARWDIRPAPRWGTIEMRACDGTATLWEAATIAAFSQCLIEHFQDLMDRGEGVPALQPWFVRENKWRAARYGLDATVIVDASGRQEPLRDSLSALAESLAPVSRRLGCEEELAGVARIVSGGNSSARQLQVYEAAGGTPEALHAVVDHIAHEFRESFVISDSPVK